MASETPPAPPAAAAAGYTSVYPEPLLMVAVENLSYLFSRMLCLIPWRHVYDYSSYDPDKARRMREQFRKQDQKGVQ